MKTEKHRFKFTVMLVVMLWAAPAGRGQQTSDHGPMAAIRAVLDGQVAAWNHGDLEGFMNGYWKSDQLTFFSGGSKTHGWQAMLDRYQKSYKSEGREMGQLEFVDVNIQLLGHNAAFVRGGWELRTAKGPQGGPFTLVMQKMKQGWKIIHDHTSARTNED